MTRLDTSPQSPMRSCLSVASLGFFWTDDYCVTFRYLFVLCGVPIPIQLQYLFMDAVKSVFSHLVGQFYLQPWRKNRRAIAGWLAEEKGI